MEASEVSRAVAAATAIAAGLDLAVDDAAVLNNSNNVAIRLLPCAVVARVAPATRASAQRAAQFEVDLAQRLVETGSPVGGLDPRASPRPYERDGFVITLWTYHSPSGAVAAAPYAQALHRLHAGMRKLDLATQHFTDRVGEAQQIVADPARSPALSDADRTLLDEMLAGLTCTIADRGAPEQPLHGEPHPGNVLATQDGPRFIDLETCCRGPVEFDLAHTPAAVAAHYPGVDRDLLDECRGLVLAMVAAWRWDADDQFPDGRRAGHELIRTLRAGPPWPTLDEVMAGLAGDLVG